MTWFRSETLEAGDLSSILVQLLQANLTYVSAPWLLYLENRRDGCDGSCLKSLILRRQCSRGSQFEASLSKKVSETPYFNNKNKKPRHWDFTPVIPAMRET
jgi:hypothetical protein